MIQSRGSGNCSFTVHRYNNFPFTVHEVYKMLFTEVGNTPFKLRKSDPDLAPVGPNLILEGL